MNDGDRDKLQFRNYAEAAKVRGGWPYWDPDARCWKVARTTGHRGPGYDRAKAKREAEKIIRGSLDNE